jgi:hypothetical protein
MEIRTNTEYEMRSTELAAIGRWSNDNVLPSASSLDRPDKATYLAPAITMRNTQRLERKINASIWLGLLAPYVPIFHDPLLVLVHQVLMHRMKSSGCPYEISD